MYDGRYNEIYAAGTIWTNATEYLQGITKKQRGIKLELWFCPNFDAAKAGLQRKFRISRAYNFTIRLKVLKSIWQKV